jgi:hypothetical protein
MKFKAHQISTGIVNNTEYDALDGVTSNIQDQLDAIGVGNEAELQYAVLTGTVNGVNTSFTVPYALDEGDIITQNGVALTRGGVDYTDTGTAIEFEVAPLTDDVLEVRYLTGTGVIPASVQDALDAIIAYSGVAEEAVLVYSLLTGTVNGVNTSFTVPHALDSGDLITWNGVALTGGGIDYTATGTAIELEFAPPTGSVMEVRYLTGTGVIPASVVAAIEASVALTEKVTLDFGSLGVKSKRFSFAVTGATTGKLVTMVADPETLGDELEMDGFTCAAWVSATNTVEAFIQAIPGPVSGTRDFNVVINS